MEELENDYILFEGLMQLMRKPIHLGRTKFTNLDLRSIALFISGSLENEVCDKTGVLRPY